MGMIVAIFMQWLFAVWEVDVIVAMEMEVIVWSQD